MTGYSDQLRAVTLTALLILSTLGGTIAFAGTAAAATGTVSLGANYYQPGDTISITVSDTDLNSDTSTSESVVVKVTSTSENAIKTDSTTSDTPEGETSTITTSYPVYPGSDGEINPDDFTVTTGESDEKVTGAELNANGTVDVTITDQSTASSDDSAETIEYTRGVQLTETGQDTGIFTGSFDISSSNTGTTIQVADGDVITVTYRDVSASTDRTATARVDTDAGAPSVISAIEYDNDGTEGDIEIAFSEPVTDADGNGLSRDDFTVYVNGEDVTSRYSIASISGETNRVVLTSGTDVVPTATLTVNVKAVYGTVNRKSIPGNVSVTVTSNTVTPDDNDSVETLVAYAGETLAIDYNETDNDFKINTRSEQFIFSGSTGKNSEVHVFDTEGRNISATYVFTDKETGSGNTDSDEIEISLRNLGLSVSASNTTIQTEDVVTGTVEADAGNRDVIAYLIQRESVVTRKSLTLDGNGAATFDFGTRSAGNYTVRVVDVKTTVSAVTAQITVTQAASGSVSFSGDQQFPVEQGDYAYITLNLQNTAEATVSIGGEESNYQINATVTDGNEDGEVTLKFNTYTAGGSGTTVKTVADPDSLTLSPVDNSEVELTSIIDTGAYVLLADSGHVNISEVRNTPEAIGSVVVEERATGPISIWEAPRTLPLSNESQIVDSGTEVSNGEPIAVGDYLVHRVHVSGIYGMLSTKDGTSTLERFIAAVTSDALEFSIVQTNPEQNLSPKSLNLNRAVNEDAIQISLNDQQNELVIILESGAEVFQRRRGGPFVAAKAGDVFKVNFTVSDDELLGSSDASAHQTSMSKFSITTGVTALSFPAETFEVVSESGVTLNGTSTWAPNTVLTVRIRSAEGVTPAFFAQNSSIVVQSDGTWNWTTDVFIHASVGSRFQVTIYPGTPAEVEFPGKVIEFTTTSTKTTSTTSISTTTMTTTTTTTTVTTKLSTSTISTTSRTVQPSPSTTRTKETGPGFTVALALISVFAGTLLAVRDRR